MGRRGTPWEFPSTPPQVVPLTEFTQRPPVAEARKAAENLRAWKTLTGGSLFCPIGISGSAFEIPVERGWVPQAPDSYIEYPRNLHSRRFGTACVSQSARLLGLTGAVASVADAFAADSAIPQNLLKLPQRVAYDCLTKRSTRAWPDCC